MNHIPSDIVVHLLDETTICIRNREIAARNIVFENCIVPIVFQDDRVTQWIMVTDGRGIGVCCRLYRRTLLILAELTVAPCVVPTREVIGLWEAIKKPTEVG